MEEKKTLKERFKEFWADKEKRNTVLCIGGVAATIISAYCLGYRNGGDDMKAACDVATDLAVRKASSDGVYHGMNFASVLSHLGYSSSHYDDIYGKTNPNEVFAINAAVPDGNHVIVYPAGLNEQGIHTYGWQFVDSQK